MTDQKRKKILVVDDDQKFVFALITFLVGNGYEALVSYDATYAMKQATKEDVDLIVLDLGLPGGGGLFVLQNLRRLPKTICIKIIVSTAKIEWGIEEKVRGMGANDFIQKPYDLEKLLEKIKLLIPQ